MATLWLVKVDVFGHMVEPVEAFGPINSQNAVSWRGFNNNDFLGPDVPEIMWPTFCKYRNPSWNVLGVRPPRPMPRALLFHTSAIEPTIGSIPAGIIDHEFLIVADSGGEPDPKSALYAGTDVGSNYECRFLLRTIDDHHRTSSSPLSYTSDDYVLNTDLLYVGPKDQWRLFTAPDDWNLSDVLPPVEIATLALSRREPHPDGASRQIIWFTEPDDVEVCTLNRQLPYTDTWPFFEQGVTIEFTPVPATRVRFKIIDPIFGPATGFSRTTIEYETLAERNHFILDVFWDGPVNKHFVEVGFFDTQLIEVVNAGTGQQNFNIDVVLRQLGPLARADVFNDGELKGTVILTNPIQKCNNRHINFQSNYQTPHLATLEITTVQ